jgi:hypothetical protein
VVRPGADGVEDTGAIAPEVIAREQRELVAERGEKEAEAIIAQEYRCDFNAAIPGAYYGPHMTRAEQEGRIGLFPWVTSQPVGTAWDIGHNDSTVVWFYQQINSRVRLIDVLEGSGVGVDWYAAKIRERDYAYADHAWPHDGGHRNIRDIGGTSLEANAKALGVRPIRVLERDPSIQTGIQAVRQLFPMLEFNTRPLPFAGETQDEASGPHDARHGRAAAVPARLGREEPAHERRAAARLDLEHRRLAAHAGARPAAVLRADRRQHAAGARDLRRRLRPGAPRCLESPRIPAQGAACPACFATS